MAFLRAFGSWLPSRRMANEELAPLLEVTPEWILEVSGIAKRRYAEESDTVAGMGLLSARDCLEKAGVTASDLGMILVASGSSDRFCPGPASQIAAGLGLALAEPQNGPDAPVARDFGAGFLAHQIGEAARQLALLGFGKGFQQHGRNAQSKHPVAEELQPLIGVGAARRLRRQGADMGQGPFQQRRIAKIMPDPRL